ncbi:MAG: alpha-glucosidase [Anaerolineaceae bacterium]
MVNQHEWWQSAVFYQIYPRSFADGNGDGMGDFKGMSEKLDYLQELGVDAVWLSPHFPSPFIDCGYDVSDYEDVAPEYGNMQDFRRFLDGLHERGMHLILDLVLNHTSDKHPWFIESRSSLNNPKRNWYIWKKGKGYLPPTNWYSTFGGSAWELDTKTGEYYYHFFFKEQPDLNWKNPEVKKAMFNAVRFWLDMGVDGFRLDAVGTLFEDEAYPDQPETRSLEELVQLELAVQTAEDQAEVSERWEKVFQYQHDLPGVHEVMRELRQVIDEYDHRVLVGETEDLAFYGNGNDELHLVFNFPLMKNPKLTAAVVKENQLERLSKMPTSAWPCNTLGNHDTSRVYTRFGDGTNNSSLARLNLTLLLTMKGTPFLYNGEEIGMTDHLVEDAQQFRDPLSLEYTRMIIEVLGLSEIEAVQMGAIRGRDKCRTPMQWKNDVNGGFCPDNVIPWLPVNPDFGQGVNVEDEKKDPRSLWHYYEKLLHYRQKSTALQLGDFEVMNDIPDDVLGFRRKFDNDSLVILLNFSDSIQNIDPESISLGSFHLEIEGIQGKWVEVAGGYALKPFGCVILKQ